MPDASSLQRVTDHRDTEGDGAVRKHHYCWVDACGWV